MALFNFYNLVTSRCHTVMRGLIIKSPRYAVLFSLLATLLMGVSHSALSSGNSEFKEATNLQALGQQSKQTGLPILLMFGAEWCEYCQVLTENVFEPMAIRGNYDGKVVLMRHVGVDEQAKIPGFDGQLIKKSEWAYQLNADLTPTVLFFDGTGKEIAPRLVGISDVYLFSGLMHSHLNIAYKNMNNPFRLPATPDLYEQQLQNQALSSNPR